MNKYFKYILLTISLFFVGSMKVEAGLISGGKRVTCDYITPSGKKIYLATEDGGKTWYADTSVAGLGLKLNPFSLAKSEFDVVDGLSTNGANCEEVQKADIKENDQQFGWDPNDLKTRRPDYYTGDNKAENQKEYTKQQEEANKASIKEQALKDAQGGNSVPIKPQNPGTTSCQSLFAGLEDELKKIFNAIKIVVPILVIVFSSLDFAKAIFGGSDDDVKKSQIKFVKRLVVAFVFFLLPTLMAFAMGIMDVIYNGGNFDCLILN